MNPTLQYSFLCPALRVNCCKSFSNKLDKNAHNHVVGVLENKPFWAVIAGWMKQEGWTHPDTAPSLGALSGHNAGRLPGTVQQLYQWRQQQHLDLQTRGLQEDPTVIAKEDQEAGPGVFMRRCKVPQGVSSEWAIPRTHLGLEIHILINRSEEPFMTNGEVAKVLRMAMVYLAGEVALACE